MNPIVEFLENNYVTLQGIGLAIAVVTTIGCGIYFMLGHTFTDKAKKWIVGICIGVVLIVMATSLVVWLSSLVG
jgi:TrbC/VIRB2 family.